VSLAPIIAGGRFVSPANLYADSALPHLNSQAVQATATKAPSNNSPIDVGNAHLVWGTDDNGVTATATIKNNQNQTVGSVVVDHKKDTVTVTQYDPATGKPDIDPDTGKPYSSTFKHVGDSIVNEGTLASEDLPGDPDDYFTQDRNQVVTLQTGDQNTPDISVDIAYNINGFDLNGKSSGLGAVIAMPHPGAKGDDAMMDDRLVIASGGLTPDGDFADPKQLTAQYMGNWAGENEQERDFVSPMPHDDGFKVSDLWSWL